MDENQTLAQLNRPTPQQWLISSADSGRRLDAFLSTHLHHCTRREIIAWIASGNVRVNNRICPKGTLLQTGDIISLKIIDTLRPNPHLPVQLLHVDDAIVVLDKPSDIPSIALRHEETDTVANFLLAHFPEMAFVSPRPLEVGVVHRLDTATSGVLVAARTSVAYESLRRQFTSRTVKKRYLALVHGTVLQPGSRRSLLMPAGVRGQRMSETTTGNGQEAQTDYVPVAHLSHYTLVRAIIPTGARHQIRVHLAALGHPIVGDILYGSVHDRIRLCLHAEVVSFNHPQTQTRVEFTSPLPQDFQAVQHQLSDVR